MKILLLVNYDSFTYNLYHYLQQLTSFQIDVIRNDEIYLNEIEIYQSIVLSPGPGLPNEAGLMMEVIKQYVATKKILGVCLGMQAIVQHFGGTLKNLQTVQHGVSRLTHVMQPDALYKDIPADFYCGRYLSWVVNETNLPDELNITAVDTMGNIMSVEHKSLPCYGVQYHPESVMTPMGKQILKNWLML
ncbi:MAG TPA: aminodeoxychorismate/anthranilate synthase component II [Bacteroidia bacterium]|nr:aminodeoxychorismate/anthranilate synthase component II [Bacteroidia bacterium]